MVLLIIVMAYLLIGFVVNILYKKRDRAMTRLVDQKINDYVKSIDLPSNDAKWIMRQSVSENASARAGWCFWRRKWPFCHYSYEKNTLISIPFWIIDIIMCEIGYKRELRYVNNHIFHFVK